MLDAGRWRLAVHAVNGFNPRIRYNPDSPNSTYAGKYTECLLYCTIVLSSLPGFPTVASASVGVADDHALHSNLPTGCLAFRQFHHTS